MGLLERSRLAFAALIALGAGSLLFDLTLSWRLPSDADWAEVAAALRSAAQPGDAVQIWPVWAERARMFVDAAPVLAEEDLERARAYLAGAAKSRIDDEATDEFSEQIAPPTAQAGGWRGFLSRWGS